MVEGVAREDVALCRRRRGVDPRVERRQVDIVVGIHDVQPTIDLDPAAARLSALGRLVDLGGGGVLCGGFFEGMRRAEQEERGGARPGFYEVWSGVVPTLLDVAVVC